MNKMTISWEMNPGDPPHTIYIVNGLSVGEDNPGFDKILDMIRSSEKIEVILKINQISSLGGDSLINTFPFKDRFTELRKALGKNKLVYEFFMAK